MLNSEFLISETERNLGPSPRRLDLAERIYILGCKWARLRYRLASDELHVVYEWRKRLLQEGDVALGVIVQANEELFSRGTYDLPANIVYSSNRTTPKLLDTLAQSADRIFALKNTEPEQDEERQFAEIITDEYGREMRQPVPKTIAGIEDVTLTTIIVFRKDLPHEYLTSGFFPVLTHPNTPAVMIVPSKFWPKSILRAWEPASRTRRYV